MVAASAGTGADAYDTALADLLPAGFTYVAGSFTNTAGPAPTSTSASGGQLTATYAALAPGATSTLTFQATLSSSTTPGQVVGDSASLTFTSLPGTVTTPESSYNTAATERTGLTTVPGGAANTYAAAASTTITVKANTIAGTVFDDTNNNGAIQAGEPGLSGATVTLTGTDDLGHAVNLTITSGADGTFQFGGLRPSNAAGFAVTSATPAGDFAGRVVAGSAGGDCGGTAGRRDRRGQRHHGHRLPLRRPPPGEPRELRLP